MVAKKKIKVKTISTRKIDIKSIILFPSTDLFILWKDFYLFLAQIGSYPSQN